MAKLEDLLTFLIPLIVLERIENQTSVASHDAQEPVLPHFGTPLS